MNVYHGIDHLGLKNTSVAIGVFDGVHLGHQAVIRAAVSHARDRGQPALSVVFTFDVHPMTLIAPDRTPAAISTLKQRLDLIEEYGGGVDSVVAVRFNAEFANLSPEQFVRDVLHERLDAFQVCIGPDFRYGHERAGTVDTLRAAGGRYGFAVAVIPPVEIGGCGVRSTRIRNLILEGDIESATALLGHRYAIAGVVVEGKKLGRTIGYPTANVVLSEPTQILPADGVYSGVTKVEASWFRSAVSVGTNPTTDTDGRRKVEAYLMDGFDADIYGRAVEIEFGARVRGQIAFSSIDALKAQIEADVAEIERRTAPV
ncbi:MAG: bifunctional riboflavin kinase/FAD synthetase [Capsulimonadaceae bacterium]